MRILITNDDGIFAPGIAELVKTAQSLADDIVVVAPNQERSGVSHGITVNHPLRVYPVQIFPNIEQCYMIDGTPADCIKLAVQGLRINPDIIISGINLGANLSTDVFYSGTVSAAFEGVLLGLPSLAVSLCGPEEYLPTASHFLAGLLKKFNTSFLANTLLNINIPALPIDQVKGIRATRLGFRRFDNEFEKRLDPFGRAYYWMKGVPYTPQTDVDHDHIAIDQGYVSVTPLQFDLTHELMLEALKDKLK